MRGNLIFSLINIPQNALDDPEKALKDFLLETLKLPVAIVKEITSTVYIVFLLKTSRNLRQ